MLAKRTTRRNIISFYDLAPQWQTEALSNLDDEAYEASYFEPQDTDSPTEHVLWDLNRCMRHPHNRQSYFNRIDGVIGISNNSAMAVKFSSCGTQAVTWYLY